jgi:flagellar basal body-associated protein FliL
MKSSTKFWLSIFTFLPLVLLVLTFTFFFNIFFENIMELEQHSGEFSMEFLQSLIWFILLIVFMGIISLGVKIYYIVHTNNNSENDTNKKIMWTLILIFTGMIGSIIYYFMEITPLKTLK